MDIERIAKKKAASLILDLEGQSLDSGEIESSEYARVYDEIILSGEVEYRDETLSRLPELELLTDTNIVVLLSDAKNAIESAIKQALESNKSAST